MSQVRLERIGGVAKAASILVIVAAVTGLLPWLAASLVAGDAEAFLAGTATTDDFASSLALFTVAGLISGAATLASAIVVIVWMHRIASNHRALHRTGTWAPGWAIGGWFLPPFLYIIPFLMFRELWKASDPSVPIGSNWRAGRVAPVVVAWFVVFGPISAVTQVAAGEWNFNLSTSERAVAELITDSQAAMAASGVVGIVAAVLFVVMAKQLTERHERLTGERAG